MKKKRMKRIGAVASVIAAFCMILNTAFPVWGYDYAKTGATKEGTVTITTEKGSKNANGYYNVGGYQVEYVLTKDFVAFDSLNGNDFYVGNNLSISGGCHFVYKPSGVVWEQGALALGAITDGKVVGSASPDSSNTVKVSFHVDDVSNLPTYICYTYQPAGGAYIHMTDSYGHNYHVWSYQNLKNALVTLAPNVDDSAPGVSASYSMGGTTCVADGVTWGTEAIIKVSATDDKSRPGGIRYYLDNSEIHSVSNATNATTLKDEYTVGKNGTYQVQAYDKVGNVSGYKKVNVQYVDTEAPALSSDTENKGLEVTIGDTVWSRDKILHISASDAQAGIEKIEVVNSKNKVIAFTDSEQRGSKNLQLDTPSLEPDTYYIIGYDRLGNERKEAVSIGNVDHTPPQIVSVKQKALENGKVRLTVTATDGDGGSGLADKAYSFDGGKTWQEKPYKDVIPDRNYKLLVRDRMDLQGNKNETVKAMGKTDGVTPPKKDEITPPKVDEVKPTNPGDDDKNKPIIQDEPKDDPKKKKTGPDKKKETDDDPHKPHPEEVTQPEDESEESVSQDTITAVIEKKLTENAVQREVETSDFQTGRKERIKKTQFIVTVALITFLVLGLLAIGLYFLLTKLHYTCILYALDDHKNKMRICRLPVKEDGDEWIVEVPNHKLGLAGTGKYLFVFHASFVKEESDGYVIITIDKTRVREKVQEEIRVRV